jgi:hypothetical protein
MNKQENTTCQKPTENGHMLPKKLRQKKSVKKMEYVIKVFPDGSRSEYEIGSGIAIFIDKHLTFQLKYKLAERCSNNQAEQLAIAKVLEKMKDLHQLQGNQ